MVADFYSQRFPVSLNPQIPGNTFNALHLFCLNSNDKSLVPLPLQLSRAVLPFPMLRSKTAPFLRRHPSLHRSHPFVSAISVPPRPPCDRRVASLPSCCRLELSADNLPLLSPFPATLTDSPQLVENTGPLSPVFATLTSNVTRKSFACHSYEKSIRGGYAPVRSLTARASCFDFRLSLLGTQSSVANIPPCREAHRAP